MNVPRRQTDMLCLANASCRDHEGPVIQPSSTSTSLIHAQSTCVDKRHDVAQGRRSLVFDKLQLNATSSYALLFIHSVIVGCW